MDMKVCKRCGVSKPRTDFRDYYGGRKGSYSFCRSCERIEQRRKYLATKDATSPDGLTATEAEELHKINELYAMRAAAGLSVPARRPDRGVTDLVDAQIAEMRK